MATARDDLTDHAVQGSPASLLTVEQVAELLNVSISYVRRRLIFEKRIAYIKIGHKVRVGDGRDPATDRLGTCHTGAYDGQSGVIVDVFQQRLDAMPPRRR